MVVANERERERDLAGRVCLKRIQRGEAPSGCPQRDWGRLEPQGLSRDSLNTSSGASIHPPRATSLFGYLATDKINPVPTATETHVRFPMTFELWWFLSFPGCAGTLEPSLFMVGT